MAIVEIGGLGHGGIIADVQAFDLPLNFFSDGLNVDFTPEGIKPLVDEIPAVYGVEVNPIGIETIVSATAGTVVVYLGEKRIYGVNNDTHYNITRSEEDGGEYNATQELRWNGGVFHGIPIYNNGFDVPQYANSESPLDKVKNLDNWPEDIRAIVVRPFRNFVIGMGLNGGDGQYDRQVLFWSDAADPGFLPPNWDFADPASKAGIYTFSETPDRIVDGVAGRDEFFVYKENSIWSMRIIGGTFVFNISKRFSDVGLLSTDCAVAYENKQFLLSQNDFFVHNGIEIQTVGHSKLKRRFFRELNTARKSSVFVKHNEVDKSIWICYPTAGKDWCDRALIWKYEKDSWTYRELPNITDIDQSTLEVQEDVTWDSFSAMWVDPTTSPVAWEDDLLPWNSAVSWDVYGATRVWNVISLSPVNRHFLMSSYVIEADVSYDPDTNFSTDGDLTWQGDGAYPPLWVVPTFGTYKLGNVVRTGLAIIGHDQTGAATVDRAARKLVSEIWPEMGAGTLLIRVGTQETAAGAVVWEDWQLYDSISELKIDVFLSTKFYAIEFKGTDNLIDEWTLAGYGLEVSPAGRY